MQLINCKHLFECGEQRECTACKRYTPAVPNCSEVFTEQEHKNTCHCLFIADGMCDNTDCRHNIIDAIIM